MIIELNQWLLNFSRKQNNDIATNAGWLEVERYSLSPLLSSTINFILNGGALLICAEDRFSWFVKFAISKINSIKDRPLVPIFSLESICPDLNRYTDYAEIYDMLSISFKEYRFWYVGGKNNDIANIALNKERGFLWILDEEIRDAFTIRSDVLLDYKLIQLYKIFESALFGVMFGKITLD